MPQDMNDGEAEMQAAMRCCDDPDGWGTVEPYGVPHDPDAFLNLVFRIPVLCLLLATLVVAGFGTIFEGCVAQADPVPVYVEGDFDFDEDVDLKDFALFQRNFTCEYGGGPG